ncbi:MAG: M28 family peptidase [Chloroflexota bacterium]|nr:M28 family peptidase [Chloroflexota bacterium]
MVTVGETESKVIGSVSQDRLMADTEALARWVRLSGSEDERQAFEYVADVLRGLGLEPVLHLAPGYISLPKSADLQVNGNPIPAITHAMAAGTPPDGLDLPLVYVGDGSPTADATKDLTGTIVLLDGIAAPEAVRAAQEAGAAACVFATSDQYVHEMIVSGVWGSPDPSNRERLPKIPVVSVGREERDRLRSLLAAGNPVRAHLTTTVSTSWREIPTLTVQVDGPRDTDEFVLLSGHIDSWHYGAMDNGSANAGMLETLRAVLPHRDTFRRGLRLAFWSGHSHGRYAGSTWYADAFWEDLHDNCAVHINVDSLGGRNATVLTEANAMAETYAVAAAVIRAVADVEFVGTRFGRAGDQSLQGIGVPSLFMSLSEQPPDSERVNTLAVITGGGDAKSGGLGWWWHTTEDTADKIDPDLLLRDARIYAAVTYRFLAAPVLPLDLRASSRDLWSHLRHWQEEAGDRFDLSPVLSRAEEVAGLAARLQERIERLGDRVDDETAHRLNQAIVAAERPLVRLNYAQSGPYAHDPARGQPPVPLLAPLDDLPATAPGSDESHELHTLLVRRCNQVLHELTEARRALLTGLAATDHSG